MAKEGKNWWDADLWELWNNLAETAKKEAKAYFKEIRQAPQPQEKPSQQELQESPLEKLARLDSENKELREQNTILIKETDERGRIIKYLKKTPLLFNQRFIGLVHKANKSRKPVVLTKGRKITYINESFLNLVSCRLDEVIGRNYTDFLEVDSLDGLDKEVALVRFFRESRTRRGYFYVTSPNKLKQKMKVSAEAVFNAIPETDKGIYVATYTEISKPSLFYELFGFLFDKTITEIKKEYGKCQRLEPKAETGRERTETPNAITPPVITDMWSLADIYDDKPNP